MIGPVSEVGKTMLSSLQGAMAKGMPVDQAIQYVKSQAATGVAPLVDLYALLKQFERLKQPPAQNPQGGNLKEQLTNLESSLVRGPQPAMPAPQAQGLASLNAGSMEEPSFAGGGIVAFSQGGQSEAPKSITPQLYTLPKSYEELAQAAAAEEAALKTPEGRAAFLKQQDEEMKAAGLGRYAKSLEMRDQLAEEAAKRAELLPEEEAALNEESYWADVAGTDQPDLISAMAKSKAKAVERKRTSKAKVQAAKEKAAEEKVLRQEAREALARGDIDAYKTKLTAANTLKSTTVKDYVTEREADVDAETQAKRARELAREQKGAGDDLLRTLMSTPQFDKAGAPNPEYDRLFELYTRGGATKGTLSYYENIWKQSEETLEKAARADSDFPTEETKKALAAARAARDRAMRDYQSRAVGGVAPAGASGMPSDFSQMSDEEILRQLGQ